MQPSITGIHHITAIAGNAQRNLDFYSGILGLQLVKKTVNYDAPEVYHLYYGNETGASGNLLTFFPYDGLVGGRQGKGMLNTTAFSVSLHSLEFWRRRLQQFGIAFKKPQERFAGEVVVYFEDTDGLGLELVFNERDERTGITQGTVPAEHALKGFYGAELWLEGYERTAALLTGLLDHRLIAEKGSRFRFAAQDKPGHYLDLVCAPDRLKGLAGSGTVHHLALSTPDRNTQLAIRQKVTDRQLNPTPVLERKYFSSIYFREPGGVLLEVATEGPGFLVDEPADQLGASLQLPAQLEPDRERLMTVLKPISLQTQKFK